MGLIYGKKANANGSKKLETTGNLSSLCECANGKGSSDTTVLTYNRHFRSLGYPLDMTMTFWQAGEKMDVRRAVARSALPSPLGKEAA